MSNVRDFGAVGDGNTDDSAAVEHALRDGDGVLEFPRGDYLITRPIEIPLDKVDRTAIDGLGGGARLLMAGAGPALHLIGTHGGTADPKSVADGVWQRQRMPTVRHIEIEGRHEQATGVLLEGVMQPTLECVLLRRLWDGVRLTGRNRNVIITHCHIYHNRHVGVFLDHVNLHQAIISASHISYNPVAGVRIEGSEIRNLQITGNDIEYNYAADVPDSADVVIDCSEEKSSVREGTICSNTIQARYSPGGANVRLIGFDAEQNHKAGLFTVTGNLIGSQETNMHLKACRGVVVTGNVIYSGHDRNLCIDGSRNIVVGPNSFDHNPDYRQHELCTGIRIVDSVDVQLTGSSIQDAQAGRTTLPGAKTFPRQGLLELFRSRRIGIDGCQVLDAAPFGIFAEDCSDVLISGCTVSDHRQEPLLRSGIRFQGTGRGNFIVACRLGQAADDPLSLAETAGVTQQANLIDPS